MCVLTCRNNTTSQWTRAGQCRLRTHASCIFRCHTSQDTAAVSARRAHESGVPPRPRALKKLKDSQPTHQRTAALHIVALLAQVSSATRGKCRRRTAPIASSHLRPLRSSRRAVRFTRGKAASRATRPGKPSRILQELTVGSYGNITKMPSEQLIRRCWRSRGLRATPPRTLSSNSSGQMIKIMPRAHCG